MQLIFAEGQNFDCNGCGRCCRAHWNVHVDPASAERIRRSPLRGEGPDPIQNNPETGQAITLKRPDGACIFLTDDSRCGVHRDLGYAAKPLACRQFPFTLRPTPDGVFVGVSFYCDAVQRNEGRPVAEHAAEIAGWLKEFPYVPATDDNLWLDRRCRLSWTSYRALESFVSDCLSRRATLEEGLWSALLGTGLVVASSRRHGLEELPPDLLRDSLASLVDVPLPEGEFLERIQQMYLAAVVGVMECDDAAAAAASTQAIIQGGLLESRSFGEVIDLEGFQPLMGRPRAPWIAAGCRRYLDHLIFRKFLAGPEPFLFNLAALLLSHHLLLFYLHLAAFRDGRQAPEIHDLHRAYDIVEFGFTSPHGAPLFEAFAEALVDHAASSLASLRD